MNFEKYIYQLCDDYKEKAIIDYHIEKPIINNGFEYEMDKQFDNEISIRFPTKFNKMNNFLKTLENDQNKNDNCYWIEHFGDEIMKEYDHLYIWWK